MRKFLLVIMFSSLAWSSAVANPVALNGSYAGQVPQTMHVQISSYLMGTWEGSPALTGLTRDGKSLDMNWTGPTEIIVNAGSGLNTHEAFQYCDCFLAPGTYNYEFVYGDIHWDPLTVVVTDPPPEPAIEKPMPEGDVQSSRIPAPPWPKGLDCVAACEGLQGDPIISADGAIVDTKPSGEETKGSGSCSAAGSSTVMPLSLLAILALGLLALRRRVSA